MPRPTHLQRRRLQLGLELGHLCPALITLAGHPGLLGGDGGHLLLQVLQLDVEEAKL